MKNKKVLLIISIILMLLSIFCFIGYYFYATKKVPEKEVIKVIENSEQTILDNQKCTINKEKNCEQTVNFNYNNHQHIIKIENISKNYNGPSKTICYTNEYAIYIDNKKINEIKLDTNATCYEQSEYLPNVTGDLYVINNKYLAIGLNNKEKNYTVYFYNEKKLLGNTIINNSNTFINKNTNKTQDINITYDGVSINSWMIDCNNNNGLYVKTTIKDNKVIKTIISKDENISTKDKKPICY